MTNYYQFEDIKNEFLKENRELVKHFSKEQILAYTTVLNALDEHIRANSLYFEQVQIILPKPVEQKQKPIKKKQISEIEEIDEEPEDEPSEDIEESEETEESEEDEEIDNILDEDEEE